MYLAIDAYSKKHVRAASAQRGRDYRCPTCRAPVHLRRGTYREAHFAHDPGQGRPECELYHFSDSLLGLTSDDPVFSPPAEILPRQRLSLWLNVQVPTGRNPATWSLEVLVPKSPGRAGTLTFDGGADGLRVELSCLRLNAGAITCPVNPNAADFRVSWVSRDVDRYFAQAVQDRIAGLDPLRANVFSTGRGSRQERASVLNWGGSYYLVYRAARLADVPSQIASVALADHKDWSCLLVTLPSIADQDVSTWFDAHTALSIMPAKQQWGIVAPAAHAMDSAARVVLGSGTDIVVAIHPGDRRGREAVVHGTAGTESAEVTLQPHRWNLLEISGASPTQPLMLRLNEQSLPEMVVRSFARTSPKVLLHFNTDTIEAHTLDAHQALERVRSGQLELRGITLPTAFEAQLRARGPGELDWAAHRLVAADGPYHDDELANWLMLLHDRRQDIVIDFGPYGYWWSDGQLPAQQQATLLPETRAHAAWVLLASGKASATLGDDTALAKAVGSLVTPRWLTAHHRLAKSRIAREHGIR
jgi:hypothetical protein